MNHSRTMMKPSATKDFQRELDLQQAKKLEELTNERMHMSVSLSELVALNMAQTSKKQNPKPSDPTSGGEDTESVDLETQQKQDPQQPAKVEDAPTKEQKVLTNLVDTEDIVLKDMLDLRLQQTFKKQSDCL